MAKKDVIVDHASASEKAIERKLVQECAKAGVLCLKFSSQTEAGYPDRLLLFDGIALWVELKSYGRSQTPLQVKRAQTLNGLGFFVFVIDSTSAVKGMMRIVQLMRRGCAIGSTLNVRLMMKEGME